MAKEGTSKATAKCSQKLVLEQNKSLFIIAVVLMALIAAIGLYTTIDRGTATGTMSSSEEVIDDLGSFKLD